MGYLIGREVTERNGKRALREGNLAVKVRFTGIDSKGKKQSYGDILSANLQKYIFPIKINAVTADGTNFCGFSLRR